MARKSFISSILRSWKKCTIIEKFFYVGFTIVIGLVLYNVTKPEIENFETSGLL